MRKLAAIAMTMTFLIWATAVALAAPQSVLLELKGEAGQEMKRDTALSFEMDFNVRNPQTGEQVFALNPRLSGTVVDITRVLEVAESGDLTFQSQIESFDLSLQVADLNVKAALKGPDGGPPQLIKLPPLPIKSVVSKNGRVVALEGLDKLPIPAIPGPEGKKIDLKGMVQAIQIGIDEFGQPAFSDEPVAVGDSWSWEIVIDPLEMMKKMSGEEVPPEAGAMMSFAKIPVKCTSTLTGFETVNGIECAKIVADAPWRLEMPIGPGMMLQEGGATVVTTWFDYQAGRAVRAITEVGVEMRAGTPESALAEMDVSVRAESELR